MTAEDRSRVVVFDVGNAASDSTRGLRRQWDRLAAERAKFSLAHELAHHVLGEIEDNRTTATGAGKSFPLLQQAAALLGMDELASYLGPTVLYLGPTAQSAGDFDFPSVWPLPGTGLPAWRIGVLSKFGLSGCPTADSGASASAESVPRVRPSGAARLPLLDPRTAYLKYLAALFADIAATAIRRIDGAQSVISAELARRAAVLTRNPGLRAFVLIILATCRRYGRRSEPDDHAVLPMRRYPTSRGVTACART
jgi:hypothetical protein